MEQAPRDPALARALGPVRSALERIPVEQRRVLVACSGGADSVTALGLLATLRRTLGLELAVGHVDHGLRAESSAEADGVVALATSLDLPVRVTRLTLDVGPGLPARARAARRSALVEQATALGSTVIVLGHTATDQAETMLMHLARGSGLDGLAAMPVYDPPWLRPLLDLTRAETRELAGLLELPFVDDPGNADPTQLRVWLRTAVLPGLRERNPNLDRVMVGLARDAGEAEEALTTAARAEAERRSSAGVGAGAGSWSLADFAELPRAVRTRVLRQIAEQAGVDMQRLARRTIDEIEAAAFEVADAARRRRTDPGVASPAPRGWDLAPKLRLVVDRTGVRVRPASDPGRPPNH